MPCTAIKGQVLADLVVEFTEGVEEEKMSSPAVLVISIPNPPLWEIYANGAAN